MFFSVFTICVFQKKVENVDEEVKLNQKLFIFSCSYPFSWNTPRFFACMCFEILLCHFFHFVEV